jgi:hypothetical protein
VVDPSAGLSAGGRVPPAASRRTAVLGVVGRADAGRRGPSAVPHPVSPPGILQAATACLWLALPSLVHHSPRLRRAGPACLPAAVPPPSRCQTRRKACALLTPCRRAV